MSSFKITGYRIFNGRLLTLGLSMTIWVLICSSCKKNIYSLRLPDKMVVLSEITAGDTANIPISSTNPAGQGTLLTFQKLNSVSVDIKGDNDPLPFSLLLNQSSAFSSSPTAVYSAGETFQLATRYHLSATDPALGTVEAYTTIPSDFDARKTETEIDDLGNKKVFRVGFNIHDAAEEKNYYILEAVKQLVYIARTFTWQGQSYDYNSQAGFDLFQQVSNNPGVLLVIDTIRRPVYLRLNVFTRDTHTDNAVIGSLDSAYRRIFISDSLFNGKNYQTSLYVEMDQFMASDSTQKGIVEIRVKSVSPELYHYLLDYEKYNLDFGNFSVGNLNSPNGNIQNGFGIFGGSAKKQWDFYYDNLQ